MTANEAKDILIWCTGINFVFLYVWFGVFVLAHDWVYRQATRWFKFSVGTFDAISYAGIVSFKIGIVLLNFVPLIALYLSA
jgi:hypothetical protein